MSLHGLKALKLIFFCSVAVSFVQLLLYRTIVLNSKYTQDKKYPWKLERRDTENEDISKENENPAGNETSLLQGKKQTPKVDIRFERNPRTCNINAEMTDYHRFAKMTSNQTDWSFTKRLSCPVLNIKNRTKTTRKKFVVTCSKGIISANYKPTNSTNDFQRVFPGDNCLRNFIQTCCSDTLPVPNVVHYVWYSKTKLSFFEFVSFMSTLRFVRPCAIVIHGDILPSGPYWDFIVNLYPNIVHVVHIIKSILFDKKVVFKEHNGDIWRTRALLRYGGIYMDTDTLLVKPIEPLRRYPCTVSRQSKNMTVSPSFIMAERNATFIREWFDWYRNYYVNDSYTYNARMYPSYIANREPESIHVEYGTISRPNSLIFNTNTDWSTLYGLHLYDRSYGISAKDIDENNVKKFNTTVGAICRHILFGNKELCS